MYTTLSRVGQGEELNGCCVARGCRPQGVSGLAAAVITQGRKILHQNLSHENHHRQPRRLGPV